MFFKKKKEKPVEASTPTPMPTKEAFNVTDVVLTLWDGTEMDTTISCSAHVSLTKMMNSIIRDGIFNDNGNEIIRVNKIRLKKTKENEESEVIN